MNPFQNHSFTASMLSSTSLEKPLPIPPTPKNRRWVFALGAAVAIGALGYAGGRHDGERAKAELERRALDEPDRVSPVSR